MLDKDDVEFYNKKGYLKMHSSIIGREVYMVKNMNVDVPDRELLRFDEIEIKYLKELKKSNQLDDEQLRVLIMAKEEFGGNIIDAKAKPSKAKRKRSTARPATSKRAAYKEPKSWHTKSQARPSV
tara:strand:+ start:158 stop:532 length:375 start_codon:yes stop_codon:yes gene_type:complete